MNKLIAACLVALAGLAFAGDQEDFCRGFEEGYKSVKGDMVILPVCPVAPITPVGSTPFREGLKAGVEAARRG